MKKLLDLTKKIKDQKLRKQVVSFLKDLRLSNKHFKKYPKEDIEEAGSIFVIQSAGLGPVERNLVKHTVALADLCEKTADCFKENYGLKLNKDHLLAAAILHDVVKVFEFKRSGDGSLEHTGITLDHTMLGVAELYSRNFPEEIIHIVASHFGQGGPTPPRSFEAVVFHELDSLTSSIEYYHWGKQSLNDRIIFLDYDDIKGLGESDEKSD